MLSFCQYFVLVLYIVFELLNVVIDASFVRLPSQFLRLSNFPNSHPLRYGGPNGYIDGRIVGGEYTLIRDFPHQISLMFNSKHVCGGSIISSRIILTAAHCSLNGAPTSYSVRAGSTFRGTGGVVIRVESIEVHNLYNALITDYDVAILKLEKPLSFSREIQPVTLATEDDRNAANNIGTVTGWGDSTLNNYYLQRVNVPIMNQEDCEKAFKGREVITNRMFCASYLDNNGRDACQGDSGGPFTVNYKLYGITSWGYECGSVRYPGVYVRLTDPGITSWILQKLEQHKDENDTKNINLLPSVEKKAKESEDSQDQHPSKNNYHSKAKGRN